MTYTECKAIVFRLPTRRRRCWKRFHPKFALNWVFFIEALDWTKHGIWPVSVLRVKMASKGKIFYSSHHRNVYLHEIRTNHVSYFQNWMAWHKPINHTLFQYITHLFLESMRKPTKTKPKAISWLLPSRNHTIKTISWSQYADWMPLKWRHESL